MKLRAAIVLCLGPLGLSPAAHAVTWHVPSECSTITAGLDSAVAGDTVLVACGTYLVHYPDLKSGVTLISETGDADCVTLESYFGTRVLSVSFADSTASLIGFTLANGYLAGRANELVGAGLLLVGSSPKVANCDFVNNRAPCGGGGAHCAASSPTFTNCEFIDNSAFRNDGRGGGLYAESDSHPRLNNCTFLSNYAGAGGGGVYARYSSSVHMVSCTLWGNTAPWGGGIGGWVSSYTLTNSIVAFSHQGGAVAGTDCQLSLGCCDLYGNEGGDWVGLVEDQYGINGNFSECPLFCDWENEDFHLQACSPCAPGNHPDGYKCGLIGTFDVGCECGEPSAVERTTWSSVKALYR